MLDGCQWLPLGGLPRSHHDDAAHDAVWVAVFLLMMLAQSYIKMLDIHRVSTHSIEATEGCLRAVLSTRCRVCAFLV